MAGHVQPTKFTMSISEPLRSTFTKTEAKSIVVTGLTITFAAVIWSSSFQLALYTHVQIQAPISI